MSTIGQKIVNMSRKHDNTYPLWQGPCGEGWNGGITQSMISNFLSCRERFRLRNVCGLFPRDVWNHRLGYGNMWHVCEEAHAKGIKSWEVDLREHTEEMITRYKFQQDEILKWYEVCRVQFPEYIDYWCNHPDVKNRTPLLQEQVFDVPYQLSSGRVVRLRGKWDSVDLIDNGVYLQENKTKGDIDKLQIERQLKFDLQTMLYLVALKECLRQANCGEGQDWVNERGLEHNLIFHPICGVRYNVVRRPLSGGKGNITPHKKLKETGLPETAEHFYERLRRDYISAEPDYWFFRLRVEISQEDIKVFRETCLDPLLETICCWYEEVTNGEPLHSYGFSPMNYRTPFGVYSALENGGSTEYDNYMETGSEVGLRRVEELFGELK